MAACRLSAVSCAGSPASKAASAIAEFQPDFVYPYHYRDTDISVFAKGVMDSPAETKVVMGPWYSG